MSRPFASVVIAYIAGLCLSLFIPIPAIALFVIAFAILLLGLVWKTQRAFLLWPLILLTGWLNLNLRTAVIAPDDLRNEPGTRTAIVTLRGTLAETPHLKILDRKGLETWRSIVPVHATELQENNRHYPVSGDVIVSTPDILDTYYFAGQPVEIHGVISTPPGPLAEGLFDYQKFLATKGIFHELKTTSTNDWHLLEPRLGRPPLTDRFLTWSRGTLALGLPTEDEPLRLLWAMTLGWRTAFTGDIADPFLRAGTLNDVLFYEMDKSWHKTSKFGSFQPFPMNSLRPRAASHTIWPGGVIQTDSGASGSLQSSHFRLGSGGQLDMVKCMKNELTMKSNNKGLTVKVNLWSLNKYLDNFDSMKARLWMKGQIQRSDTKEVRKFNDAGELISILGMWNSEKFQELKAAKKNKS